MTALRYGDVVIVDWRGHELDRESGRIGSLATNAGDEVPGDGDVEVLIAYRGARSIPRDRLRVFGVIGWAHEQPKVGDMVAMAVAFPSLHIELRRARARPV